MIVRTLFITLLLLCQIAPVAAARMYQWQDPDTGTTQLSGTPPAWYRSNAGGPRVFVFEKGQLLDDTARKLPEDERKALRQQALIQVEEDLEAARTKAEEAERLRSEFTPPVGRDEALNETEPEPVAEARSAAPETADDNESEVQDVSDEQIEQMRELIRQWEASQQ
ncbi:MAG: hypothetical protein WD572_07865 [Gammaproteobacteria bacterium]